MSHHLPPLTALRAFEAAARLGRMSAAADELSVTPGAISRQVRQLEQHMGVPPFDGTKARLTLTPAARMLQPPLPTAFAQLPDNLRELSDESASARHLSVHQRPHSGQEWRRFSEEHMRRKYARAKCC